MIASIESWSSKVEVARVTDLYLTDRNIRMNCQVIDLNIFNKIFVLNSTSVFVLNFLSGESKAVFGSLTSCRVLNNIFVEIIVAIESYKDLIEKQILTNVTVENILLKRKLTLRKV